MDNTRSDTIAQVRDQLRSALERAEGLEEFLLAAHIAMALDTARAVVDARIDGTPSAKEAGVGAE